jgi:molecular chaperone GrpE
MNKQEKKVKMEQIEADQSVTEQVIPEVEHQFDWEGKYLRALADYQNLLKQGARERQEFAKYANEGLLQELLPVYEHLRLSLQHAPAEHEWTVGVGHVVRQFKEVLSNAGVQAITTVGEPFDHASMTAVQQDITADANLDDLVAKELRCGYRLHGKVIIPAQVVVYKYQQAETTE